MPTDFSSDLLVAVNSALAGVTLFGGLVCLAIWLYDRTLRAFLWASLLAWTMTLTLLSGAAIFAAPGPGWTQTAVFVRSTLYGCCALLAVRAAHHILPGLPVRWIGRCLLALFVVRTAVWWPTELLIRRAAPALGWPEYAPLVWTSGLYNIGIVAAGALAYRRSRGTARLMIIACGVSVAVLTAAPLFVGSGQALEETVTLNVLPGGFAILFLAGWALLRTARGRDTLTRRQDVLLRLAQAAVTESVDAVRHRVERELRTELRREAVVALSGLDRFPQPGTPGSTIRVSGRRQRAVVRGLGPLPTATGQFVEAALRILLAASERALGEADFAHAAGHDQLTGLLNLAALTARLGDRLHDDTTARLSLVVCRLDGLGQLAAVDGPDRVDELISDVASALVGLRRSRTTLARLSSEAFAVADQVPGGEADVLLTDRLSEIRSAVTAAVPQVQLTIGAAVADPDATPASLLSDAAVALERATVGGTAVFDDAVGADVRTSAARERDLEHAVARDEIEVRYQPVVAAGSRAVISVEALARWRHDGVVIAPDAWIPTAERLGLIHDIGQRVLEIAARDQQRLQVPVAVNVSPTELAADTFVADVLAAIGDCPPGQVILEMTESAVMADLTRSVAVLQELRAYGVRIALDDFGSSYSSLAALADLPVDILKLDASFVARLEQTNGVAVVQAVTSLGRSLGKPIVAEGIETEAQLTLVTALGVDRVQGYLLGRPAEVDELAVTMAAAAPRRLLVVGAVAEVG